MKGWTTCQRLKLQAKQKTKVKMDKMKVETSNEIGYSKESRKLGKDKPKRAK